MIRSIHTSQTTDVTPYTPFSEIINSSGIILKIFAELNAKDLSSAAIADKNWNNLVAQKKIILSLLQSIKWESSIHFSRSFYNQLATALKKISREENLLILSSLLLHPKKLESYLPLIPKETCQTLSGDVALTLSMNEIKNLKGSIFGVDLHEFIVKNAPSHDVPLLEKVVLLLEKSTLFSENEKDDLKSSILCLLNKFLLNQYENLSFANLFSAIEFIENLSSEQPRILSSIVQDNTLAVSKDSSEEEISMSEEVEDDNINDLLNTDEYHYEALDYLRKLAALKRFKEFNTNHLNLIKFKAILNDVHEFLGDIDTHHKLYPIFYSVGAKFIELYMNQLADLNDLSTFKPFYDQLFTKIGHEALIIEHFVENDSALAENENQNSLSDLIRIYVAQGFPPNQARQMATIDLRI